MTHTHNITADSVQDTAKKYLSEQALALCKQTKEIEYLNLAIDDEPNPQVAKDDHTKIFTCFGVRISDRPVDEADIRSFSIHINSLVNRGIIEHGVIAPMMVIHIKKDTDAIVFYAFSKYTLAQLQHMTAFAFEEGQIPHAVIPAVPVH